MKKILMIASIALIFAAPAFAADTIVGEYTTGELTFNASNGVSLNGDSTAVAYVFMAMHKSGSRCFLTNQTASKIFFDDVDITLDSNNLIDASSWPAAPVAGANADAVGTPASNSGDWAAL